jgi:8-oxo-dGTP pyrophosphatase MutT (NUDIX family)
MQQGVVVVVQRDGMFLAVQRAPGILAGGAWCFVGGGIEQGESQEAAVEREFFEEVGGKVRALRKVWEYQRADGALQLHWWLAEMVEGPLVLNLNEVVDARWLPLEDIASLENVLDSNREFIATVRSGGVIL